MNKVNIGKLVSTPHVTNHIYYCPNYNIRQTPSDQKSETETECIKIYIPSAFPKILLNKWEESIDNIKLKNLNNLDLLDTPNCFSDNQMTPTFIKEKKLFENNRRKSKGYTYSKNTNMLNLMKNKDNNIFKVNYSSLDEDYEGSFTPNKKNNRSNSTSKFNQIANLKNKALFRKSIIVKDKKRQSAFITASRDELVEENQRFRKDKNKIHVIKAKRKPQITKIRQQKNMQELKKEFNLVKKKMLKDNQRKQKLKKKKKSQSPLKSTPLRYIKDFDRSTSLDKEPVKLQTDSVTVGLETSPESNYKQRMSSNIEFRRKKSRLRMKNKAINLSLVESDLKNLKNEYGHHMKPNLKTEGQLKARVSWRDGSQGQSGYRKTSLDIVVKQNSLKYLDKQKDLLKGLTEKFKNIYMEDHLLKLEEQVTKKHNFLADFHKEFDRSAKPKRGKKKSILGYNKGGIGSLDLKKIQMNFNKSGNTSTFENSLNLFGGSVYLYHLVYKYSNKGGLI